MITAKIIADSISKYTNARVTTFELEYPRFIHSELMTHRMFSKNAASSRAIPIRTMIDNIRQNPAEPVHWGKNQSGMQAKEELQAEDLDYAQHVWYQAKDAACHFSERLADVNTHKQIANRITEPFQHMKVVLTGTDFANLWWLRDHPDAQPEFQALAKAMHEAYNTNQPIELEEGMWHLPYVDQSFGEDLLGYAQYFYDEDGRDITLGQALKISVSCCAQVSYRKSDMGLEKAEDIYKRLIESKPCHASPTEHQALCFDERTCNNIAWRDLPRGITHITRDLHCYSGNLRGWIQYRQLLPDNVRKY